MSDIVETLMLYSIVFWTGFLVGMLLGFRDKRRAHDNLRDGGR